MTPKKLPLRLGVGAVVLNKKNQVFVGKRKDNPIDKWQMPQGGVNTGENLIDAMKRELHEETNIQNIKILNEIDGWFEYELPKNLLGKIWKGRYRGQKQKWFALRFLGYDADIDIETDHPEFHAWKWAKLEQLPDMAVDFKRSAYEEVRSAFQDVVERVKAESL